MRMPTRQAGYSLLELTTVVAVIGTLSAVALPRYAEVAQSARVAKMDMARAAIQQAAQVYHMKWMLAGSPARTTMLGAVEMNAKGFPTAAGILVAAGIGDRYDTRVPGVVAADAQHAQCALVYVADTGASVGKYEDADNC